MDILIAIFLMLILASIVVFEFYFIRLLKQQPKQEEPSKDSKLTNEDKEKQEKLRKNFENLMGYDYTEALKGGEKKEDR